VNSATNPPPIPDKRWLDSRRFRNLLAVSLMLIAVATLYRPWLVLGGNRTLFGFDYLQLHTHRIRYAREALFGPHPCLPAWYSRELLGRRSGPTCRVSFIPNRLLLLLSIHCRRTRWRKSGRSVGRVVHVFYCRRIGLAPLPAASSGWTFAASGFFVSRIMGATCPLEAYPHCLYCFG